MECSSRRQHLCVEVLFNRIDGSIFKCTKNIALLDLFSLGLEDFKLSVSKTIC